jgi:hypothetical protein
VTVGCAVALSGPLLLAAPAAHAASPVPDSSGQFTPVRDDVPSGAVPIVADFNGDHRDDILWYGPGSTFDQLMLGAPGRTFTRVATSINGSYEPLTGDFNGDHHADIFWYAPGTSADYLWLGRGNATFSSHPMSVSGSYRPVVADFNGDHRDDILWYAPGAGADYVAYGTSSGAFSVHPVTINGSYDEIVGGDFNGDGRTDLLFWSSTTTVHPVWFATSTVGFVSEAFPSPAAAAIPMVMNVDNDTKSDIVWYGPGGTHDALAESSIGLGHLQPLSVQGNYQPLWGNFDGDAGHHSDILWWAIAPGGADAYWKGTSGGLSSQPFTSPHVDWSSHLVAFGDFDGDGAADICFYDSTGRDTSFYFGNH